MKKNGRITDVIVSDNYRTDPEVEIEVANEYILTVWADENMSKVIFGVEGVTGVYHPLHSSEYTVYVDPRYDREYIKREIEAVIKCR
jgi:hypothetical protein